MAIENMKVEPQREITESVIGVVVLIGVVFAVYRGAVWVKAHGVTENIAVIMIALTLSGIAAIIASILAMYFTHFIGEEICAGLKKIGMDPRPKTRYEIKTEMVWNEGDKTYTTVKNRVVRK